MIESERDLDRKKLGAIDGACEFTVHMISNLKCAIEHPDMIRIDEQSAMIPQIVPHEATII